MTAINPLAKQIGDTFADHFAASHTKAQLAEVRRRNASAEYAEDTCATHDFCDANMIMLSAFEALGIPAPVDIDEAEQPEQHEAACVLWGEAWSYAKAEHLTARKGAAQ